MQQGLAADGANACVSSPLRLQSSANWHRMTAMRSGASQCRDDGEGGRTLEGGEEQAAAASEVVAVRVGGALEQSGHAQAAQLARQPGGREIGQQITCTSPGASPRVASTLATTSSLRMWGRARCSIVAPCSAASGSATADRRRCGCCARAESSSSRPQCMRRATCRDDGLRSSHDSTPARFCAYRIASSSIAASASMFLPGARGYYPVWFRLVRLTCRSAGADRAGTWPACPLNGIPLRQADVECPGRDDSRQPASPRLASADPAQRRTDASGARPCSQKISLPPA
jgi:hypothetical protein